MVSTGMALLKREDKSAPYPTALPPPHLKGATPEDFYILLGEDFRDQWNKGALKVFIQQVQIRYPKAVLPFTLKKLREKCLNHLKHVRWQANRKQLPSETQSALALKESAATRRKEVKLRHAPSPFGAYP